MEKKKVSIDDVGDLFVLSIRHYGSYDDWHETLWLCDTLKETQEMQCKDFIDRIGKDEIQKNYKIFFNHFMKEEYETACEYIQEYDVPFVYQIEDFSSNDELLKYEIVKG